ncbi:hypothetical protein TREES_T100012261 [Tupaia chinensis]|uniref:Uncharacterized protein n=1 Tax=Tupaia chinensis TaxID=246437 RepID=L9JG36_TUPCH|nr:hypothetical protein TREES_T100012261 [Tupaia chinensis]
MYGAVSGSASDRTPHTLGALSVGYGGLTHSAEALLTLTLSGALSLGYGGLTHSAEAPLTPTLSGALGDCEWTFLPSSVFLAGNVGIVKTVPSSPLPSSQVPGMGEGHALDPVEKGRPELHSVRSSEATSQLSLGWDCVSSLPFDTPARGQSLLGVKRMAGEKRHEPSTLEGDPNQKEIAGGPG